MGTFNNKSSKSCKYWAYLWLIGRPSKKKHLQEHLLTVMLPAQMTVIFMGVLIKIINKHVVMDISFIREQDCFLISQYQTTDKSCLSMIWKI